jgi:hypothetical protein
MHFSSDRVSYYKIKVDDHSIEKHKSSGIAICTGTGSSSWFYHINNLPQQAIKTILGYGERMLFVYNLLVSHCKMVLVHSLQIGQYVRVYMILVMNL